MAAVANYAQNLNDSDDCDDFMWLLGDVRVRELDCEIKSPSDLVSVDFEVYNRMAIPKRDVCKRRGLSYGHHERTRMGLQISRTVGRTTLRG
jgi:hypothetical protein